MQTDMRGKDFKKMHKKKKYFRVIRSRENIFYIYLNKCLCSLYKSVGHKRIL